MDKTLEEQFVHEYRSVISERYLDMYGHVNNAEYAKIFEEARWAWIGERGGDRNLVEKLGKGPIVIEMKLRFSRELVLGDTITIKSWRAGSLGRTYTLHQHMIKESGEVACKAEYRMAFLDLKKRKITEAPEEWKRIL